MSWCPVNLSDSCTWPDCECILPKDRGISQPVGPMLPTYQPLPFAIDTRPRGCICPPGAEASCKGIDCPRNPPRVSAGLPGAAAA